MARFDIMVEVLSDHIVATGVSVSTKQARLLHPRLEPFVWRNCGPLDFGPWQFFDWKIAPVGRQTTG